MENQIIARLRDQLGTARNANEMFRVFSKFNVLFVRPKVSYLGRCPSLMLTNLFYVDLRCYTGISDPTN
jgi:hypothetical protein